MIPADSATADAAFNHFEPAFMVDSLPFLKCPRSASKRPAPAPFVPFYSLLSHKQAIALISLYFNRSRGLTATHRSQQRKQSVSRPDTQLRPLIFIRAIG
jgi:hypothetical protein